MDLYDSFASLNKDSSYPTVFSLLIVNKEGSGDMQPSISIEETEVSNIKGGKSSFMTIYSIPNLFFKSN